MANWEKEDLRDREERLKNGVLQELANLTAEQIAQLPTQKLIALAIQAKQNRGF